MLNQESVLAALRTVQDPDLRKDLVTLNMIRDLEVSGDGNVSLRVVLTTPACPMKGKIENDVRAAVMSVAGVKAVKVRMDSEVRGRKSSVAGAGEASKSRVLVTLSPFRVVKAGLAKARSP